MAIQTGFISVNATGVSVTSGATTANVALPTMANGNAPKYVRLQADSFLYVRLGNASVTATTNDMLLSPNMPEYVSCAGFTNIAYLQKTAGAQLNIVPLES